MLRRMVRLDPTTVEPDSQQRALRRPDWLKANLSTGEGFAEIKRIMRTASLHTVCEEARCPNIYECWAHKTATFMILGDICTRACRFCAVTSGKPTELDLAEPDRVAQATFEMGLRHVVVTSVARDDLADGGAAMFAATIRAVRARVPQCNVEVLIPDFQGREDALAVVLDAEPSVLNHNVETVRRLSDKVRSRAKYDRSLALLERARQLRPRIPTKSSLMLGVGETKDEVQETLEDLRTVGVSIVTLGQYLQPTRRHLPVARYWSPDEFAQLRREAMALGFAHVEAGPLVRSSYHAFDQAQAARASL